MLTGPGYKTVGEGSRRRRDGIFPGHQRTTREASRRAPPARDRRSCGGSRPKSSGLSAPPARSGGCPIPTAPGNRDHGTLRVEPERGETVVKRRIGVDKVFAEEALRKCGPAPAFGGSSPTPKTARWTGPRGRYGDRYPPITLGEPVRSGTGPLRAGEPAPNSKPRSRALRTPTGTVMRKPRAISTEPKEWVWNQGVASPGSAGRQI
jgi:hypothetical protein